MDIDMGIDRQASEAIGSHIRRAIEAGYVICHDKRVPPILAEIDYRPVWHSMMLGVRSVCADDDYRIYFELYTGMVLRYHVLAKVWEPPISAHEIQTGRVDVEQRTLQQAAALRGELADSPLKFAEYMAMKEDALRHREERRIENIRQAELMLRREIEQKTQGTCHTPKEFSERVRKFSDIQRRMEAQAAVYHGEGGPVARAFGIGAPAAGMSNHGSIRDGVTVKCRDCWVEVFLSTNWVASHANLATPKPEGFVTLPCPSHHKLPGAWLAARVKEAYERLR